MADAIFKELPVRVLGYGFAIGEALVYVGKPRIVEGCYVIGLCFVCGHCIYSVIAPDGGVVESLAKAFMWEALASCLFPTLVAFHTARLTYKLMEKAKASDGLKKWVPCLMGLIVLPVLLMPLDEFCEGLVSAVVG